MKVLAKMKKIFTSSLVICLAIIGATLFVVPPVAYAEKNCPVKDAKGVVIRTAPYCCGTDSKGQPLETSIDFDCDKGAGGGANTVTSLLLTIINFLAVGVGIAVVGGIVFGALRYTSADGNAAQAQQGITFIVNSVLGLILFIFMYAIINYLVPGGLLT